MFLLFGALRKALWAGTLQKVVLNGLEVFEVVPLVQPQVLRSPHRPIWPLSLLLLLVAAFEKSSSGGNHKMSHVAEDEDRARYVPCS